MSITVLLMGDMHTGSMCGLTPDGWLVGQKRDRFFSKLQEEMWSDYLEILEGFGEVDYVVVNGDVIDGNGKRSGGTELITTNLFEQVDMAVNVLGRIKCSKKMYFTYGTPYHPSDGDGNDFDSLVAKEMNGVIDDQLQLSFGGLLMNVRHDTRGSSVPYSRSTAITKEHVWDQLYAIKGQTKPADVHIRSHVHFYTICGDADWYGFTLPALQASNTKYGARRCSGITDWGMCKFTIDNGKLAGWDVQLRRLEPSRTNIINLN